LLSPNPNSIQIDRFSLFLLFSLFFLLIPSPFAFKFCKPFRAKFFKQSPVVVLSRFLIFLFGKVLTGNKSYKIGEG